jgi:hypothetical protein
MHGVAQPTRSPARLLVPLQALIAALLVPALVLGSLDLHSSDVFHGAYDGPTEVLPDARHPLQPEHLEASGTVHVPSCSACLLQLKSSCGAADLPAHTPEPVVAGSSFVPDAGAPRGAPGFALRSRAPPLA